MKPPLSPTTRIEETSSCQGRGNQDSKFSYILRSRCTEHVSVRKCSYTWIFVSLESAEDHGYKQSGTTKAEEGNDQHICKATAAAAGMLFYRFFGVLLVRYVSIQVWIGESHVCCLSCLRVCVQASSCSVHSISLCESCHYCYFYISYVSTSHTFLGIHCFLTPQLFLRTTIQLSHTCTCIQ